MDMPRRIALIRLPDEPTVEELDEKFRRDVLEPGALVVSSISHRHRSRRTKSPTWTCPGVFSGCPRECASQSTMSGNLKNIYFISGVNSMSVNRRSVAKK